MKGLAHKEEYQAVAAACAKYDFYLEPTGGIDLENFEEIVQIAVDAGVKNHSSCLQLNYRSRNRDTRTEDVKTLLTMMKKTLNK